MKKFQLMCISMFVFIGWQAESAASGVIPISDMGQPIATLAPMLEKVTPAVVNVNSKTRVRMRNAFADDPFFRHFFGLPSMPQERVQQSLGSGVIVDAKKGYVLTNNHVIDRADDIQVTLTDGRTLKAKKIGADPDSDVAVIQIPAEGLTALALADSSHLRVGDFVVAVGNPFGLGQTATSGIVSALGRTGLKGLGVQNFIQTDASINPGNSGGALVNLHGELVGINTAIFSPSGGNVGIGFAIPASLVSQVMQQLMAFGEVKRGSLGVQAQDVNEELAVMLKLKEVRGAVLTQVRPRSPAAEAGLRAGDVIVALNDKAVHGAAELSNLEGLLPVGVPVQLVVIRDGVRLNIATTLKQNIINKELGEKLDLRLTGAKLSDSSVSQKERRTEGVVIVDVVRGSRAAANGLRSGDIIVQVNQRDITELTQLSAELASKPRQLLLTIIRDRQAFFALLQ
jgi:serine protease DegQ